jgi:hypothetical protein
MGATAATTVSSETQHHQFNTLKKQHEEDRIALLNKANNGGRPQQRGVSAGAAGYGRTPAAPVTAATANFFYGAP